MITKQLLFRLVLCFAAIYALAALAALGSAGAPEFYAALTRPAWAPPAWLFGPVWTLLYSMMPIAAFLLWRAMPAGPWLTGAVLFALQLVLNVLWSWLFFAWHLGAWALVDIVLLIFVLLVGVFGYWRHQSRVAVVLMVPYIGWVGFAAMLNFSVWQLNPTML